MKRQHRQRMAVDANEKPSSSPWWDIFSHCKEWEEHDDYYLHNDTKSKNNCGGILSLVRPMPQFSSDEDRQHEVMTLHHQIGPQSSTSADVLRVREDYRVGDNNIIKSNPISADAASTSINTSDDNSIKEDVDAAMSQFVLSRILGSIDPSAVVEKERDKGITFLCVLDEGNTRGHLDEGEEEKDEFNLDALNNKNGDINDTYTTASLSLLSEDDAYESDDIFSLASDIIFSELHACHEQHVPQEPTSSSHHVKDLSNAVLAWGALSLMLNAPAPSALNVHKKGGGTATPFEEDEATIDLDDIISHSKEDYEELESVVDDDEIFQHWLHRQTSGVLMRH